jgi:hypothetical protein
VAHRGRRNADEALALALAGGQTLRAAAAAAGIGERTATRRWADPAFRRRVSELRGDMVQRSLGRMADGMSDAADMLRQLLDTGTPPAVRLGAARTLLELGAKLRDSVELANKVDELERLLHEGNDGPTQPRMPTAEDSAGAGRRPPGQGENTAANGPGT